MDQTTPVFDYNIFLIGFMGTGKSTIARKLKAKLQMDYLEMDETIVQKQGMPIAEIFERYGEGYFRDLESSLLIELQSHQASVISCGGGVIVRPENADHMKKHGRVVLLTATPETVYNRVRDNTDRPILNNHMNVDYIRSLMEQRRERYEAAADLTVSTDRRTPAQICDVIITGLKELDDRN
ncbi:MAG: shikimate kinase [Eubacteriales bacterium]|nr:shikimate kinase [Eubacteriales bacterium]